MKRIKRYRRRNKKTSIFVELVIALILLVVVGIGAKEVILPNESIEGVQLVGCVDGDTAKLRIEGQTETVRFLAIDTPETKHPNKGVEPFGKEASDYTCDTLKNANVIRVEFDLNSNQRDKYNRILAWVFVDDKLLQEELLNNGLAKIAYLYGDYSYMDQLYKAEQLAQANNLGVWE
ncbi:thermonuclease family protein [Anaerorhabdus sp.]|uniref:thermonuclease family protein n=1 Tax=Anaerorhabdus sp. TaxID=1872524 RepID=UPI002FC752A8